MSRKQVVLELNEGEEALVRQVLVHDPGLRQGRSFGRL